MFGGVPRASILPTSTASMAISLIVNEPKKDLTAGKRERAAKSASLVPLVLLRSSMAQPSPGLSVRRTASTASTASTAISSMEEDLMVDETKRVTENASLISLCHTTGSTNGIDIIYSTLLKLIECATNEITLVYGYFQLFPQLEKALSSAIDRGVRVRLFTNSSQTSDLFFLASLFAEGQGKLLQMGAEVYTLNEENNRTESGGYHCAHHKFVTVDNRAVMCGSWNCIGASIFHDSEFAMLLFEDEESCSGLCTPFRNYFESSLESGLYKKLEDAPIVPELSPFIRMNMSKQMHTVTKRGF